MIIMAKILKKLTDAQIEAKKDAALSDIAEQSELAKQGRSTPTQIFLNKIKDVITVAIESNLSYKEIAKSIYSQWNVKVSDQTIKRFAENTLGIKKERAQKQTVKESVKAETKTALKPSTCKNHYNLIKALNLSREEIISYWEVVKSGCTSLEILHNRFLSLKSGALK